MSRLGQGTCRAAPPGAPAREPAAPSPDRTTSRRCQPAAQRTRVMTRRARRPTVSPGSGGGPGGAGRVKSPVIPDRSPRPDAVAGPTPPSLKARRDGILPPRRTIAAQRDRDDCWIRTGTRPPRRPAPATPAPRNRGCTEERPQTRQRMSRFNPPLNFDDLDQCRLSRPGQEILPVCVCVYAQRHL